MDIDLSKEVFWTQFKEKYSRPYQKEIAVPYERFIFLSVEPIEDEIFNRCVSEVMQKNGITTPAIASNGSEIKNNCNGHPVEIKLSDHEGDFKSAVVIVANNKVVPTIIGVELAKLLNIYYPQSILYYSDKYYLRSNEIPLIKIDSIMRDPEIAAAMDSTDYSDC